jgi:hypothetical protein
MGITDFAKNYFVSFLLNTLPRFRKIYIDTNYFFCEYVRNIEFYSKKYESETIPISSNEISKLFMTHMLVRTCEISDEIIFVFDSEQARRLSKWQTCLKRKNYSSNKPNFNVIAEYIEKTNNKNGNNKIKMIISDYDADGRIHFECKNDKKSLNNFKICDESISDLAIFSGDSDFLCMFPNKIECCICNIKENMHKNSSFKYVFLNFKLIYNLRDIDLNVDQLTKLNLVKSKFQKPMTTNFINLLLWMIGSTSSNDHITASFWNIEVFQAVYNFLNLELYEEVLDYASWIDKTSIFPFLYFEKYILDMESNKVLKQKKKYIFTNSFKFLNFSKDETFYKFEIISKDVISSAQQTDLDLDLLFGNLITFDAKETSLKEKEFKSCLTKYKQRQFNLTSIFKKYINDYQSSEQNLKFKFVTCCSVFIMLFSLSTIFFNINNYSSRNIQYYFANFIWKSYFKIENANKSKQNDYRILYSKFIDNFLKMYNFGSNRSMENIKFFKMKSNAKLFSFQKKN